MIRLRKNSIVTEKKTMKKYEYVKVTFSGFFSYRLDQHRSIIDDYARRGYRFAGYVPTKIGSYGTVQEMDLIFEKDEEI